MARGPGLKKALAKRFDDELKFFQGWVRRPKAVGSIVPTSAVTAREMASVIDPASGLPVLEIGPGTGVITRAILARGIKPENLYAVEYSPEFVRHLRRLCPGVNVIEGDAFNLAATLGDNSGLVFDSVISGVPLLNFPVARRVAYLESLLDRIPAGRLCSSPTGRCRRCRPAAATTRSSTSISWCGTFRRPSSGSTVAAVTIERPSLIHPALWIYRL